MRFHPHNRVIELLVGQQLYTSADAAIRELLQNAEDACELQKLKDSSYEPSILVRYSISEQWVEVLDNGLGMNQEALTQGFASVGAPKVEVSHIRQLLAQSGGRQIGQFGIGVLSCFGVAGEIILRTKMDGEDGLAFRITDYHKDFEPLDDPPVTRGTAVRLLLKTDGAMRAEHTQQSVERYARHAAHVELEDVGAGTRRPIVERWNGSDSKDKLTMIDNALRQGVLALDPSWDTPGSVIRSGLTICNGGFLVTEREPSLLPTQVLGYVGEIDVEPGRLTILLNREGFQRDAQWQELGTRLTAVYNQLLNTKMSAWEAILAEGLRQSEVHGIDRAAIVLTRGPAASILQPNTLQRLNALLAQAVRVKVWSVDETLSLSTVVERARVRGVAYYVREGQGVRQFQQGLQSGSANVQVTEVAQTESLRATHLRAKGELVINCRQRAYSIETAGQTQNVVVHEADLLAQELSQAGVRWVAVESASPEEVELEGVKESSLLGNLLGFGEDLKFAILAESGDRVLRDFAGRLLNCAHPEVRDLLKALPEAAGNPVRRVLLQIYLDIDNYQLTRARERTKELFMDPNLSEQAQLSTGTLTKDYLTKKLETLLSQDEATK